MLFVRIIIKELFIAGKSVKLSLQHGNYAGGKAIDGIYVPSLLGMLEKENIAHTKKELSPWIQIDLSTNNYVFGVKIWDRSESLHQGCMHVLFNQQN